ncbi:MATE family efflux transporter [Cytobacillus sp. S13-E01]|uniref:MATE family efflux transporter n=1 Tax=Cytobacillus sp. S13-E01 TaxID=3031326 RepID=UPI0023D82B2E|nr:MATE family efflux transporter [Cytobacillus sp. S13-E01]MDF0725634.1 MATE family efflux transporter [Cytobacillus sp. S13-E01]
MEQTYNYKQKYKQFLTILIPILVTQLGLFAMNFFDVMMSGRIGANDLAGVAIGSSLWVPVFTGLSGILLAITPIVAQLVGRKYTKNVPFTVIQGIYVSVFISILVIIFGALMLDLILNKMSLEPEVHRIAKEYLIALSFGIIPLFVYTVLRSFIDALGHTRVSMVITLISLPINVIFNYLLIFGKLGFPQLGGVGAGFATAITYWCITFISLFIIAKQVPFTQYNIFRRFYKVSFTVWKEILLIGVPIGFAIFFETSIFAAVTLLMSSFNTITIASHQAALNFASFLYMIPLSISMALTIVIGYEVGSNRLRDARQYSILGIWVAVGLSLVCAAFIFFFREQVASIYTKDPDVLDLTKQFLVYAIFFQLSDAIAAPIQGALRGYKDVNTTFFMAFISFWIIGLPVGVIIATYTSFGAFGYWIGLIAGLAVGAIGLSGRLIFIQKQARAEAKS